ncbi:MAG: signal protein PDZ [Chloroflexi bacterium]|nr:MAG: signal protein PDZ [Chloroflexota bacterium]
MSESLTNLSNAMASLVEAAGPGIVRVEARRRMPASGIVYSAEGLIVTANHIVEQDDNITIGLADGSTASATLVGRDPATDVALLRAERGGLAPATWVDAGELKVGHLVLALGRPGRTVQATLGIVSALGGAWRTGAGGEIDHYLQTDVVMYPGFSGGPLVEAGGRIAGLNSSALTRGVSAAVPAATVKRVVDALAAHGKMPRGYLGVGVQPVRLGEGLHQAVGQETGLMVMSIESGSPAQQGGLAQGDVIVTFDNQPVRGLDELQAALAADRAGKSVPVRIVRTGQVQTVTVTVGQG